MKAIEAMEKIFHADCKIENCKRFGDNCGQCYAHQLLDLRYPGKSCPECGSSGRIFRLPVTALGETSNEFPCPKCKGTGVIPGGKMLAILDENQELPTLDPHGYSTGCFHCGEEIGIAAELEAGMRILENSNWRKVVLE